MKKLVLLDTDILKALRSCISDVEKICKKMYSLSAQADEMGIPLSKELLKQFEAKTEQLNE